MELLGLILAVIFFIVGFIGTVLPILPGVIFVFSGMVVYGIMTNFHELNIYFFLLQSVTMMLVFVIDFIASAVGTRRFDGSKQAAAGGAFGIVIGLIVLGPLGIAIGPFVGAVGVELISGKDMNHAIKSGFGSLIGILGGTILKLFTEAIMISYFFISIS
ncbi:MAG: Uncharacterized protein XD91_1455 [Clostridiales bacterium 38_11]|nr:MAG: Uncharacterized protein XD91_1455 [Clostridiales bacterium 38_11]HBH13581.1 DUF456 domain-containing protein [Clostridiales bacterium]